jgi:hypothetical protein
MEDVSIFFKHTHHVLYRNTWSKSLHKEAEAQRAATLLPHSPSLRAFPYGTAVDGGNLSRISAPSPPASQRPLLFSFKGGSNPYKPSRELLRKVEEEHRESWQAVSSRLMQGSDSLAPPGLPWRYLLDIRSSSAGYRTQYDYVQLLRDSIFTLSPPGDVWEAYRTYEAMEAGSIPVVVNNASYKVGGCVKPAAHMLARMPFVVSVDSWDELPTALSRLMTNFSAVTAMQEQMRAHLLQDKADMRRQVVGLVRAMRSGRWKPRTSCTMSRLSSEAVAAQHIALSRYWRRPQPMGNFSYWDVIPGTIAPRHKTMFHRPFSGPQGWCALGGDDFEEECVTGGCGLPLIESIRCAPVEQQRHDRKQTAIATPQPNASHFVVATAMTVCAMFS